MIGSLRGRILLRKPDHIILDVGGVGYMVNIPLNTFSQLSHDVSEIFLYIYTHVREGAINLFGFIKEEERDIFTTLLNVNGIGPKMAINILSYLTPEEFRGVVESEDVMRLSRIPGLGKKTANRIILELKGKLSGKLTERDTLVDDAVSALVNLGYQRALAIEAVEKARRNGLNDIESILKESLKYFTGE